MLKKNKSNKFLREKGFSLLELVLAVAIFSLGSFAIATLLIDSNISTQTSLDRTEALLYAKEGIEATRSIRNNSWDDLADGNHGLLASSTNEWVFDSTSDVINDKYTRTITISSPSDSSRLITSTVSWALTPSRTATTTLVTQFTDWPTIVNGGSLIPTDGLVAYWSFDGNANDSVGTNHGTVNGATLAAGVDGVAEHAYSFDGNDYINTGADFSWTKDEQFSISFWLKPLNSGGWYQSVIGKARPQWEYNFWNYGNDLNFCYYNTVGSACEVSLFSSTDILAANVWTHVVVTYSINNAKMYINGVVVSQDLSTSGVFKNGTAPLTIGYGTGDGGNSYFLGGLDNIRIYNRALEESEVTTVYNEEKPE